MTRDRLLREACELVVRIMNLRPPQAEALRALRDALLRLPTRLQDCSQEQRREFLSIREGGRHPFHPTFSLSLATGVGKTRLAGAIIAMLWLTAEARTFLILAPRRAVLRRFENALDTRFREYIFVDPNLVPEPSVVRSDEIDGPRAFEFDGDLISQGPKIFLLSPQLVATSERFQRSNPLSGVSPAEALATRKDLIVIVDEAHHVGRLSSRETTAWAGAIRALSPCLQIGMTATPRGDDGENILYEYPLRLALKEGLYTKNVHICVRTFEASGLSDEDVDRAAIDYSLDRLERKRGALSEAISDSFPSVKPVCVFFARDIAHAEQVTGWLIATSRVTVEEVLLTHSAMAKSEEELERLLSIERPENKVRVVVNVMELTEGWDVTNVYVVTPLRAMATFQGALQAMGRGLRLPAGRRVGNPVLDELDVVCFGREKLERIVTEATDWTGAASAGGGIKITRSDESDSELVPVEVSATQDVTISCADLEITRRDLNLVLSPDALQGISEAVVTEIDLVAARTRLGVGRPRIPRDRFARAAALRCIRSMPQFLSDEAHLAPLVAITREWLSQVSPGDGPVEFDPVEVGEEIAVALRRNAKLVAPEYNNTNRERTFTFPSYTGSEEVMLAPGAETPLITVEDLPVFAPAIFRPRQLYRGWNKSVYRANAFDSEPEALLARLLDRADELVWWVRNAPVRLEIDTPAGRYRPDFVTQLAASEDRSFMILEAKADFRWEDPWSEARIKNRAAHEWVARQRALGYHISLVVALESDIRRSGSWSQLAPRLK
jgi:superfamily II DNA or RNA helicase